MYSSNSGPSRPPMDSAPSYSSDYNHPNNNGYSQSGGGYSNSNNGHNNYGGSNNGHNNYAGSNNGHHLNINTNYDQGGGYQYGARTELDSYMDAFHDSNQHGNDFPDENKSYTSQTHLNSGANKEFGVGEVIPSVPYSPVAPQHTGSVYGYPPPQRGGGMPMGMPMGMPGSPQLPASPGFSGSSHWHQVRNNLMARRVVKRIPLTNGNLVMDVPVPKGVIPSNAAAQGAEPGEMDKLRYSAATCDPDDFMRRKFSLRQFLYGRKTELFVSVVTDRWVGTVARGQWPVAGEREGPSWPHVVAAARSGTIPHHPPPGTDH